MTNDRFEKVRAEVERLFNHVKDSNFESDSGAFYYLKDLLEFIDSLQEEPISSVWRKPTETPKEGCAIVSVTDSCSFLEDDAFFLERYIPNWEGFTKEYNITRWAYKHDLMDKL